MARTKKATRRAPEAAEEAEVAEVVDGEKVAEAPPKKGRKNKKEAPGKDAEQPLPKKLRSSNKEEEAKKDDEKPSAKVSKVSKVSKVAKVKIDPAKADVPLLVFAHGAGAPSSHEWMVRWKKLLGEATGAVEVVTFDYPYCANGKKGAPPKAEKLVGCHKEEIEKAMSRHPGHPVVLVGKSMGSRVSCMVAGQEDVDVAAVVCLGYPLKVAHKNELRDKPLLELKAPVLFVQGCKDAMCPLTELHSVRNKMTVKSEVHAVQDGDHSLKISKKLKITQDASDQKALNQIKIFISKVLKKTL
ncbi:hypothetical protein M758_2G114100 [Ceratodon purpureus]|nr:hypothetical protein M758_2G114100 [Ceratodon purpureus]KAG0626245.1 hypothetical protein M758_2G114100 [Ceratodon purpureus]KAG0626246.1 hypothetical protein M758_2G114100 [Ceratodon purpureus]